MSQIELSFGQLEIDSSTIKLSSCWVFLVNSDFGHEP